MKVAGDAMALLEGGRLLGRFEVTGVTERDAQLIANAASQRPLLVRETAAPSAWRDTGSRSFRRRDERNNKGARCPHPRREEGFQVAFSGDRFLG